MRNRCNGTHGRWWDSSPWLRSSSFTSATVKPSPARRWVRRERRTASIAASAGPRRPARFVGGGVAAEGACEGSLGEEFGEEFGEQAGESPVTRGAAAGREEWRFLRKEPVSPRPGRCSPPCSCALRTGIRCFPPRGRTCVSLATAVMGLRPAGPGHVQDFLLGGVRGHGASTSLCVRFSMGGGHRVPVGNGRESPCRSDAALLQRPYGGALEGVNFQASLLVHFSAVADNVQPQSGRCCWTSGQGARQWCASVGTTTVRNWPRFRHRSARGPRVRSAACPV